MEKSWNQCKFAKNSNDEVLHYLPANTFIALPDAGGSLSGAL